MIGHKRFGLLLLIFGLLALLYSLILPLGEAADESEHFGLIRFIAETGRPPLTIQEQNNLGIKGDAPPLYHALVALLTQHVDISPLPDLPDPRLELRRAIPADRLPFKGLYHTQDEGWPWRGIVLAWHLARLVSIPLGVATLTAIYLTGLALAPERPGLALAATGLAAFIPRFVINSAIVSNDNLVLPLITFSLYGLVRISQGVDSRRLFLLLGLLMGLAALTKYHSLLLVPEMTLIAALAARRYRRGWGWALRRWGQTMLAFGLVAGGWLAFLLIRFNQVIRLGWMRGLLAPLGDPVLTYGGGPRDLGYETALAWPEWTLLLFRTFWFRYGRGHVIEQPLVTWGLVLLVLIAAGGVAAYYLACHSEAFFAEESLIRYFYPEAGRLFRKLLPFLPKKPAVQQPSQGFFTPLRSVQNDMGQMIGRQVSRWSGLVRLDLALLSGHFLLYLGLVNLRYLMLPTRETAQGRHLYPALLSIAFFLAVGLAGWTAVSRRRTGLPAAAVAGLFAFSLATLPLFVVPVYYPYLPIRRIDPDRLPVQHRVDETIAEDIRLLGYSLPEAARGLPITLYWQGGPHERDYLVKLCLEDGAGEAVACHLGHPANGRYPMRAWEAEYMIEDEIIMPVPACLPPGQYGLRLSLLPLALDTAAARPIAELPGPALGPVHWPGTEAARRPTFELWLRDKWTGQAALEIEQIRQTVSVIGYDGRVIHLLGPADDWPPVVDPLLYRCPDGSTTSAYAFIVDAAVSPGLYRVAAGKKIRGQPDLMIRTRPRRILPPVSEPVAAFGDKISLLRYELDPSPRLPGDMIPITMQWQTRRRMVRRYVASFHLLDREIAMQGQIDRVLGENYEYPNNLWAPNQVISQTFRLPVEHDAPPGLYTIEFGLYTKGPTDFEFLPVGAGEKHLLLGQIRVRDPAYGRPPAHPMRVELGGQIELLGYDLEPPAGTEPLRLALHWRAIHPPQADYTVFTQLIGPAGRVWSQQDNQPQAGRYPTTAWPVGEPVIDRYALSLPPEAPPGPYRLLAGMYDLTTGQRLTAIDETGQPLPHNAIELTIINKDE